MRWKKVLENLNVRTPLCAGPGFSRSVWVSRGESRPPIYHPLHISPPSSPVPIVCIIISLSSQCDTTTTDSHPLPNGRVALTVYMPPRGVRSASERPSATKLVLYSSSYFGHRFLSRPLFHRFTLRRFIASSSNPLKCLRTN